MAASGGPSAGGSMTSASRSGEEDGSKGTLDEFGVVGELLLRGPRIHCKEEEEMGSSEERLSRLVSTLIGTMEDVARDSCEVANAQLHSRKKPSPTGNEAAMFIAVLADQMERVAQYAWKEYRDLESKMAMGAISSEMQGAAGVVGQLEGVRARNYPSKAAKPAAVVSKEEEDDNPWADIGPKDIAIMDAEMDRADGVGVTLQDLCEEHGVDYDSDQSRGI